MNLQKKNNLRIKTVTEKIEGKVQQITLGMESNTRFILVICNVFSNYAMFCHMDLNKTKDNIEVEILFWDIWEMFVNFGKMQALYIYVRGKL